MLTDHDAFETTAALSADSPTFKLAGGAYAFGATATWGGGTAKLQVLAADGSTYLDIKQSFDDGSATIADLLVASLAADGMKTVFVPPGTYKLKITTATGVWAFVRRISGA